MNDAVLCELVTNTALILVLCAVLSWIMYNLNQSSIPGYMILGMLIASFELIPDQWIPVIENIGKIGVLLLLFTAGLEIEIIEFLNIGPIALSVLFIEILTSIFICGICGYYFDANLKCILLWTFVCVLSSTAVTLNNLHHTKSTHKLYAVYAMSVLVAQDICFPSMQLILRSIGNKDPLLMVISEICMSVLIPCIPLALVFAILYFIDLRYVSHRKSCPEHYLWAALAACFTISSLFGALHISMEYGAFLAGLLCSGIGDRHESHRVIEPIVRVISAIFFMWIGITTDISIVRNNIFLVTIAVLCISMFKTVINVCGLYFITKNKNSLQGGLLLVTLSEFSFPLIEAYGIHDFSSEFLKVLVIMSMLIGGIWYDAFSTANKEDPKIL